MQADVLREQDIERAIGTAVGQWDRLDILFDDACGPSSMPQAFNIEDVDEESFKYARWCLLGSAMVATRHASPIMRKQRSGSIIDNSSKGRIGRKWLPIPSIPTPRPASSNYTKAAAMQLGPGASG